MSASGTRRAGTVKVWVEVEDFDEIKRQIGELRAEVQRLSYMLYAPPQPYSPTYNYPAPIWSGPV